MVMNGKYTHGILKKAKEGDFRVQDDYGGTVHDYIATPEEIAYAENAVKSCPEMPIYARVDVFLDNQNKLALAQLQLVLVRSKEVIVGFELVFNRSRR